MKKSDLLTKADIAQELSGTGEPMSIRNVERYIGLAGVKAAVPGSGRGKQSFYRREDVEKIKAAHRAAAETREQRSLSLTPTRATPAPVALVGELIGRNTEAVVALSAALDLWPVWLTRTQALERTGLPASWFDAGARDGDLPHVGRGRGRRFHRDEVRAFAERVRNPEHLKHLLEIGRRELKG